MTENNKELINKSLNEKKITSPSNIDYLINKLKEHDNIKGIRYERKYANGDSESLSIWKQDNKIKEVLTINKQ